MTRPETLRGNAVFRDLKTRESHSLPWTPEKALDSVDELYKGVQTYTIETIDWYHRQKRAPSAMSRWMRGMAIALFAAGGLCPLLASANLVKNLEFNTLGIILIAIAGALLVSDRYAGFSSAWMRYISTSIRLQRLLQVFQLEWQISRAQLELNPDPAQRNARILGLLELLRSFVTKVLTEVEQETETWMTEFRDSLAQLQRLIREQQTSARPGAPEAPQASGSVVVTVTNFAEATERVAAFIDDMPMANLDAATKEITPVAPGAHSIKVRTSRNAVIVEAAAEIVVPGGQKAPVSLTFHWPDQPRAGAGAQVPGPGAVAPPLTNLPDGQPVPVQPELPADAGQ